jgi:hypothetical protein
MSEDTIQKARLAAADHATQAESLTETLERLYEHDKYDMADRLRDAIAEAPLCVDVIKTIRVTIGTGGPAYGVDFTERGATVWHQDWFIERQHVDLSEDAAQMLADAWGIDLDAEFGS